jgi:hypothetical protein
MRAWNRIARKKGSRQVTVLGQETLACALRDTMVSTLLAGALPPCDFGEQLALCFCPVGIGIARQCQSMPSFRNKISADPDFFVRRLWHKSWRSLFGDAAPRCLFGAGSCFLRLRRCTSGGLRRRAIPFRNIGGGYFSFLSCSFGLSRHGSFELVNRITAERRKRK